MYASVSVLRAWCLPNSLLPSNLTLIDSLDRSLGALPLSVGDDPQLLLKSSAPLIGAEQPAPPKPMVRHIDTSDWGVVYGAWAMCAVPL